MENILNKIKNKQKNHKQNKQTKAKLALFISWGYHSLALTLLPPTSISLSKTHSSTIKSHTNSYKTNYSSIIHSQPGKDINS